MKDKCTRRHDNAETQWVIGSTLQLELLDSSALNSVRICLQVSERKRKCHGVEDDFYSRSWALLCSYIAE